MPYSYDEMLVLAEQRVQRLWPLYRKHYCGDREDLVQTAALALWEWARNTNADTDRLPEAAAEKLIRSAIATEVKNNRIAPPSIFVELEGEQVNVVEAVPTGGSILPPLITGPEALAVALKRPRRFRKLLPPDEQKFLIAFTHYKYDIPYTAARMQITPEEVQQKAVTVFTKLAAWDRERQERKREHQCQ